MYEELVKTVRLCVEQPCCDNCPRYDIDHAQETNDCCVHLLEDAADAIEHLKEIVAHQQDEIDRKDKALQAWVNTWEQTKGKLIDRICENCETPPDVRLRVCGECPIIQPIREVFDEQQS